MKLFEKKYFEKNAVVHVINTQKNLNQSNAKNIHELKKTFSIFTSIITVFVSSITSTFSTSKLICDLTSESLEIFIFKAFIVDMSLLNDFENIRQIEHEILKNYYFRVHSILLLIDDKNYSIDFALNFTKTAILLYIVKKFINELLNVKVKNKLNAQINKLKNLNLYKTFIIVYRLSKHWRLKSIKQIEEKTIKKIIRKINEKIEKKIIRKIKKKTLNNIQLRLNWVYFMQILKFRIQRFLHFLLLYSFRIRFLLNTLLLILFFQIIMWIWFQKSQLWRRMKILQSYKTFMKKLINQMHKILMICETLLK